MPPLALLCPHGFLFRIEIILQGTLKWGIWQRRIWDSTPLHIYSFPLVHLHLSLCVPLLIPTQLLKSTWSHTLFCNLTPSVCLFPVKLDIDPETRLSQTMYWLSTTLLFTCNVCTVREDVSADRVTKLPRVTLFATVIYLSDLPYSKWNYLEILIKLQGYLKVVTIFKDLRGIGRYQMNLFCVPLGQQIHDAHGEVSSKECLQKNQSHHWQFCRTWRAACQRWAIEEKYK